MFCHRYSTTSKKSEGFWPFSWTRTCSTLVTDSPVKPICVMINNETNELLFDRVEVPAENLHWRRGARLPLYPGRHERRAYWRWTLVCGAGTQRARECHVSGRPIGQNQGVQFPIAQAYIHVEMPTSMRLQAVELFGRGEQCGPEANMAKLLAANVAMQTYGGYGLVVDYEDIEGKFRETGCIKWHRFRPISFSPSYEFPSRFEDRADGP